MYYYTKKVIVGSAHLSTRKPPSGSINGSTPQVFNQPVQSLPYFRPFTRRGPPLHVKQFDDLMMGVFIKYMPSLQARRLIDSVNEASVHIPPAITTSFEGGAKLGEIQQLAAYKNPQHFAIQEVFT